MIKAPSTYGGSGPGGTADPAISSPRARSHLPLRKTLKDPEGWVFGHPPIAFEDSQSISRRTLLIIRTGLGTLLIVLPPLPPRGEGARPASVPASAFSYLSWRQPACQPTRQDTYFRALRTLPRFQIILGRFLTHAVRLPRADGKEYETVLRTEEKGSDVNLASHLLHDAHRALMDCAVVVSNDSDLAEPIRLAREDLGMKMGLISPTFLPRRHPSRQLARHAHFIKRIRGGALADSLFPDPVLGPNGPIHRPRGW